MKKYSSVLIIALLLVFSATAQNSTKLQKIKAAKLKALNLQTMNTSSLKKLSQFKSADPMQKSFLIASTKKSAQTRTQAGAVNLSITSPDGKTIKRITKVASVDGTSQQAIGADKKEETVAENGSKTVCTSKKIRMEAGYSDNNLLSPMEEVMWLGNILDGNSILNGGYAPLNTLSAADRNAYPISIDLNAEGSQPINGTIGADGVFGRGAFNNAVNAIKNQGITLEQTGENGFTYSEVFSSSQVYANLSAGLSVTPVNLTSNISLAAATNSTKTSYLVQFYEIWYTATLDANTWELVKDINKVNNEALVVTSIKYGRMGTFMFETTTDMDSLQAYLDVAFNVDPNVAVSTVNRAGFSNVHRNTSIKSYANGANAALTSLEDFLRFVKEKTWRANSPAQPIGFTLRFVKDGQIANVLTTTEFTLRSCDIIPPPGKTAIRFNVSKIEAVRDVEAWGEDLCGKINVSIRYKDANGRDQEYAKKQIWNVGCSPSTWMAGIDQDDPLELNKQANFEIDATVAKTAYVRVSFDIRDGLEGKNQAGINEWNLTSEQNRNKGFVQYKKFEEDYPLTQLTPDATVSNTQNAVTLQEEGGTPRIKVSFVITKSEIK